MDNKVLNEMVSRINLEESFSFVNLKGYGLEVNNVYINNALIDQNSLTLTGDPITYTEPAHLIIDFQNVLNLIYDEKDDIYKFVFKNHKDNFCLYVQSM